MIKILSIALAFALAGTASAVTMQWGASGVSFDGTRFNATTGAAVTGYLVALDSLGSYELTSGFAAADVGPVLDSYTGTTAVGRMSSRWTIDTDTYGNGDTFAVLLSYANPTDGKTYWNLTSALVTMSGMSLDPPADASNTASTFSYSMASGSTLTAGGGWTVAVPEPATGALALAGVALLFRRRKA